MSITVKANVSLILKGIDDGGGSVGVRAVEETKKTDLTEIIYVFNVFIWLKLIYNLFLGNVILSVLYSFIRLKKLLVRSSMQKESRIPMMNP